MMKAVWNGVVVAAERRHGGDRRQPLFSGGLRCSSSTCCPATPRRCAPWKGQASYHTLLVNGDANPDAVWTYPEPKGSRGRDQRIACRLLERCAGHRVTQPVHARLSGRASRWRHGEIAALHRRRLQARSGVPPVGRVATRSRSTCWPPGLLARHLDDQGPRDPAPDRCGHRVCWRHTQSAQPRRFQTRMKRWWLKVAEQMRRAGRIVWRGLRSAGTAAQAGLTRPCGAEGIATAAPTRWVLAMPDVFSIRKTTVEDYAEPVAHEIKVRRADLLSDLRRPGQGCGLWRARQPVLVCAGAGHRRCRRGTGNLRRDGRRCPRFRGAAAGAPPSPPGAVHRVDGAGPRRRRTRVAGCRPPALARRRRRTILIDQTCCAGRIAHAHNAAPDQARAWHRSTADAPDGDC